MTRCGGEGSGAPFFELFGVAICLVGALTFAAGYWHALIAWLLEGPFHG